MKVQIWSDIMCPFCYLGDQNLKNAIQEYSGNSNVEVEFKAFQLNPLQEKIENPDNPINYTIKKGMPAERVRSSFGYIETEARNLGLPIDLEHAKVVNSLDCLRLVKYAQSKNKYNEVKDALFRGYFVEGKDLSDHQVLLDLAVASGLDKIETERFLNSSELTNEVENDRNLGISKGLQGVPFFVIDDQYVLSGNQSKEQFLKVFKKIKPTESNQNSCNIETGTCD
ncbi:DsbA family oxidoreductase [Chryseobacterium sp.]|uniref:DsbA family oxidoreductase n=1 Tax=Chryseobacterium sp. TaxID=1871047 RepID=UPI00388FA0BA